MVKNNQMQIINEYMCGATHVIFFFFLPCGLLFACFSLLCGEQQNHKAQVM